MNRFIRDISHWFLFTLVLALVPLLFSLWRLYSNPSNTDLWTNIGMVISHGELLLLCCSMLAKALGELVKKGASQPLARTWLTGVSAILLIYTALVFSDASAQIASNSVYVASTSYWVFMGTVMVAVSSIILPDTGSDN